MQQFIYPLGSTSHTSHQSQREMGDIDPNVEPEQDSLGGERAMVEWNVENVQADDDNSRGGGQRRKRKHVTIPLFRSPLSRLLLLPRIRPPSMQHRTSPLGSTSHTSHQSQREMDYIDLNVEPEQDS